VMFHFIGIFFKAIAEGWGMFWSLPKEIIHTIDMVFDRVQK